MALGMRFFRWLLGCATLAVSLAAQQTPSSEPLTDQRIMELVHAGVSAEELARIIATAPSVSFFLCPAATDVMLKSGVSEATIKAMAEREQHAPPSLAAKLPGADVQSKPPAVPSGVQRVTHPASEKREAHEQTCHGSGCEGTKRVRIHGYVTAVDSPTEFEIDEYKIKANGGVVFEVEKSDDPTDPTSFKAGELRVGDELEIKGTLHKATGQLAAESVKINLDERRRVKRTALIEATPTLTWVGNAPRGIIAADGQRIIVDSNTTVLFRPNTGEKKELKRNKKALEHGDPRDNQIQPEVPLTETQIIGPNTFVSYQGIRQTDGTIRAQEVKFMANELTPAEAKLRKAVTAHVAVPNYAAGKAGWLRVEGHKYKLVPDERLQRYVQSLGMSLVPPFQRGLLDNDAQKIPFQFYVIDLAEPNATARPNGVVVVHSGLLMLLENEAQLAAVLSHEIAHAVQEHSYRQTQYHKNVRMAIQIGGAVASAYGKQAIADVATLTGAAIRNGYQRSLENQADRLGMQYMLAAGYDPREAPQVWKVFALKRGDGPTNFFWDDHDNNTTRRSYLMAELRNNYANVSMTGLKTNSEEFTTAARLITPPRSARHLRLKPAHTTASLQ